MIALSSRHNAVRNRSTSATKRMSDFLGRFLLPFRMFFTSFLYLLYYDIV